MVFPKQLYLDVRVNRLKGDAGRYVGQLGHSTTLLLGLPLRRYLQQL